MPTEKLENTLYEWGKVYGDVIYLHMLGKPVIVLNSVEAAIDLLDKRSVNYSDRPPFVIPELIGWVRTLPAVGYGEKFQKLRRIAQNYLGRKESLAYRLIPARETRVLLQNLLSDDTKRDHFLERCLKRGEKRWSSRKYTSRLLPVSPTLSQLVSWDLLCYVRS